MKAPNFRLRASTPRILRRFTALLLVFLLILGCWLLWTQVDKTLRDYAAIWCGDVAARAINTAVLTELQNTPQLSKLLTNEAGRVTAIEVDGAAVSRIKAAIALKISKNLTDLEKSDGTVPLGTLIGSSIFVGRGPRLRFRMMPLGNAQTKVVSRFVEAGVNQTTWQLVLQVDITVAVMLPGAVYYRDSSQETVLCETVVVGEVPQVYAETG